MITMAVFFNLFFFISFALSQKLEDDSVRYPEWLELSIEDPEFNESTGFYKKLQTSRPVYKKPRSERYLSFQDNSWVIGANLKADTILLLDGNCPMTVTNVCNGIWRDGLNNTVDVKVDISRILSIENK